MFIYFAVFILVETTGPLRVQEWKGSKNLLSSQVNFLVLIDVIFEYMRSTNKGNFLEFLKLDISRDLLNSFTSSLSKHS